MDAVRRFLVVATGRGRFDLVPRCLDSIASQQNMTMDVCVVDDASPDPAQADYVKSYCGDQGWTAICNIERRYALANQTMAWRALEPRDDDVVVWVDLDDRLAHPDALATVAPHYDRGALITYGSYRPDPLDHPSARLCRPARPYPALVIQRAAYRSTKILFNHLRTVSWRVLRHLTDDDLRDDEGAYWQANTDASVMIPALEMAGRRAAFISDVLYLYTCDSPDAVWRAMMPRLKEEAAQLGTRSPKRPLW